MFQKSHGYAFMFPDWIPANSNRSEGLVFKIWVEAVLAELPFQKLPVSFLSGITDGIDESAVTVMFFSERDVL
jgi:hypothetical protein